MTTKFFNIFGMVYNMITVTSYNVGMFVYNTPC